MIKDGWYKIEDQSAMAKVKDNEVTDIVFARPYGTTDITLNPHKIYSGNKVYFNKKYNKLIPFVTDEKAKQINGIVYSLFAFMMYEDNADRLQEYLIMFMNLNEQSRFYSAKFKKFQESLRENLRVLNEKYNTNYTIDGETSFLKLAQIEVVEKMMNENDFNVEMFNHFVKIIWEVFTNIRIDYEFDEWLIGESRLSSLCTAVLELRLEELQGK